MQTLYEGAKGHRLQVAARHSRRSRALMGVLVTCAFAALALTDGGRLHRASFWLSLAWLVVGIALGVGFRELGRRGRLLHGLVAGYALDAGYTAALVWLMGGSEWIAGLGLMATMALAGLYLPERGIRWVLGFCAAALALVLAMPHLGFIAPPAGAPFQAITSGSLALVVDASVLGMLSLVGYAALRFGQESSRREEEMRQANQRLRSLNETLSDQQFSLLVGQQDLLLANERLRQKGLEVLKSQDVISTLAQALEARDHYTQGHSSRVAEVAVLLARELGLSREEQDVVRHGCLLHDIGKIHVPDAVLRKPGALSDDEYQLMRKHPAIGEQICRPLAFARPFLAIVRHHHERWDGKGYPDGLKGEEVSVHARITAIADAWDAMTSDRPYRTALPPQVAFGRLEEGAGTQFDPNLIEVFVRVMKRRVEASPEESRN